MTPEKLQAIRERANNATPGPWEPTQESLTHPSGYEIESPDTYIAAECCGYTGSISSEADAVFISHARTDIPALLDHVDELTARLAAVRELHRYYTDQSGKKWCDHCAVHVGYEQFDSRSWPCPTIRATEGDQ